MVIFDKVDLCSSMEKNTITLTWCFMITQELRPNWITWCNTQIMMQQANHMWYLLCHCGLNPGIVVVIFVQLSFDFAYKWLDVVWERKNQDASPLNCVQAESQMTILCNKNNLLTYHPWIIIIIIIIIMSMRRNCLNEFGSFQDKIWFLIQVPCLNLLLHSRIEQEDSSIWQKHAKNLSHWNINYLVRIQSHLKITTDLVCYFEVWLWMKSFIWWPLGGFACLTNLTIGLLNKFGLVFRPVFTLVFTLVLLEFPTVYLNER